MVEYCKPCVEVDTPEHEQEVFRRSQCLLLTCLTSNPRAISQGQGWRSLPCIDKALLLQFGMVSSCQTTPPLVPQQGQAGQEDLQAKAPFRHLPETK